jgi:hypothetical protein
MPKVMFVAQNIFFWYRLSTFVVKLLVFPKLNRHSPSFIFDLPLSVGNFLLLPFFFNGFHIAFLTVFFCFFKHAPSLGLLSFSSLSNVGLLF